MSKLGESQNTTPRNTIKLENADELKSQDDEKRRTVVGANTRSGPPKVPPPAPPGRLSHATSIIGLYSATTPNPPTSETTSIKHTTVSTTITATITTTTTTTTKTTTTTTTITMTTNTITNANTTSVSAPAVSPQNEAPTDFIPSVIRYHSQSNSKDLSPEDAGGKVGKGLLETVDILQPEHQVGWIVAKTSRNLNEIRGRRRAGVGTRPKKSPALEFFQKYGTGDQILIKRVRENDLHVTILDCGLSVNSKASENEINIEELLLALRHNTVVTSLNFTRRTISNTGAAALAQCLRLNNTLIEVDVSYTGIQEAGALDIAHSLLVNTTLQSLSLEGNLLGAAQDSLAQVLKTTSSLTSLNMTYTDLPVDVWVANLRLNCTITEFIYALSEEGEPWRSLHDVPAVNQALKKLRNSTVSKAELAAFIGRSHMETVEKAIKLRHIAALQFICNIGFDFSAHPDMLLRAIETYDIVIVKLVLCNFSVIGPEVLAMVEKINNTEIKQLISRVSKDPTYFDFSGRALPHLVDAIPKQAVTVDLSDNSLYEFDLGLIQKLAVLPRLTALDLSKNSLRTLPEEIALLTQLRILNVSDNKLDTLPSAIGDLKNLRQFDFAGNPISANVSDEVTKKGAAKILSYLDSYQAPTKNWNRIKLLVVGQENVGKTHLVKCLRKQEYPKNMSTDGIEVASFNLKRKIKFVIYDFGGQELFYPTHQFFLCDRAIYLIVFNLVDTDYSRVEYWLKKLKGIGKLIPPPIIMVGTHLDDAKCTPDYLQKIQNQLKKWKSSHSNIQGHMFISSPTQTGLRDLKALLFQVAQRQKILTSLVPQAYIKLDQILTQEKTKKKVLSWEEYTELATHVHITQKKALEQMTEFLNDVGSLIWFDTPNLRELVILDDQWLASVMASVISFKQNWRDGVVPVRTLDIIWRDYPVHLHKSLVALLVKFEVMFPLYGDESNLVVPSLLPENEDANWSTFVKTQRDHKQFDLVQRIYRFDFIPVGFFSRLVVRMFQAPEVTCHNSFRRGFLLTQASLLRDHPPVVAEDVDIEIAKQSCLDNGLSMGYQQASVHWEPQPESSVLTINVWTPQIRGNNEQHLLVHYVMIVEGLINEAYTRYEESITRTCTFTSDDQHAEYAFGELLQKIQSGQTFVVGSNEKSLISISRLAPDISFEFIPLIGNEDIKIVSELGQGGCGIVYKGELADGMEVAVKELRIDSLNSRSQTTQFREFQHEVYMMSGLNSPFLVQLLGIQVQPLRMVLEFVPGRDLSEVLQDTTLTDAEFDWPIRRKIALDIATGMTYLHHHVNPPIIHRDLRSPNCFVMSLDIHSDTVHCKVADFGLAQRMFVNSSERLFTWQWLAPEVLDEKNTYDQRADIFSYGVVLWEIATRKFPYDEFEQYKNSRTTTLTPEQLHDEKFLEDMQTTGWVINRETGSAQLITYNKHKFVDLIIHEKLRPTIPNSIPRDFAELASACWQQEPDKRPLFTEVLPILSTTLPPSVLRSMPVITNSPKTSIPQELIAKTSTKVPPPPPPLPPPSPPLPSPTPTLLSSSQPISSPSRFSATMPPSQISKIPEAGPSSPSSTGRKQIKPRSEPSLNDPITKLREKSKTPRAFLEDVSTDGDSENSGEGDNQENTSNGNNNYSNGGIFINSTLPANTVMTNTIDHTSIDNFDVTLPTTSSFHSVIVRARLSETNRTKSLPSLLESKVVANNTPTVNKIYSQSQLVMINENKVSASTSPTQVIHSTLEPLAQHVSAMTYVDDGERSAVWTGCADGKIIVYDLKSAKRVAEFSAHKKPVTSLAVINSKHVWSGGGDSVIIIWSVKRRLKDKSKKPLLGHTGSIVSIVPVGDDEKRMTGRVWTADSDGNLCLWKGQNRLKKSSIGTSIYSMIWCSYSNTLWAGCSGYIAVLDTQSARKVYSWKAHRSTVIDLVFFEKSVWSCAEDGVCLWSADSYSILCDGREHKDEIPPNTPNTLSTSPPTQPAPPVPLTPPPQPITSLSHMKSQIGISVHALNVTSPRAAIIRQPTIVIPPISPSSSSISTLVNTFTPNTTPSSARMILRGAKCLALVPRGWDENGISTANNNDSPTSTPSSSTFGISTISNNSNSQTVNSKPKQLWVADNSGHLYILTLELQLLKKLEAHPNHSVVSLLSFVGDNQVWSASTDNTVKRWFSSEV